MVKRKFTYQYNVNRKKLWRMKRKVQKIDSPFLEALWNDSKSAKRNLEEMGLVADPNASFRKSKKDDLVSLAGKLHPEFVEKMETEATTLKSKENEKSKVADVLACEANKPSNKIITLPEHRVQFLCYLLDTYKTNYRAMAKDKRNYYQETWKQLKRSFKTFKNTENYRIYLEERNLSPEDFDDSDDNLE